MPRTAAGDSPFLFYNKSMLRSAGIDPTTLATWDGLLAATKAITRPLGDVFNQIGFPYPGGHFPTWLLVSGGGLLSADGRRPTFNSMRVRQALSYLTDGALTVYGSVGRLSTFFSQLSGHPHGNMDTAFKVFFDQNPNWQLVLDTLAAAMPLPPTRGWDRVRSIVERIPSDVLGGRGTVSEALDAAEREAQTALDEAYR